MGDKEQLGAWRREADQYRAQERAKQEQVSAQQEQASRLSQATRQREQELARQRQASQESELLARDVANRQRILRENNGNPIIPDVYGANDETRRGSRYQVSKHIGELTSEEAKHIVESLERHAKMRNAKPYKKPLLDKLGDKFWGNPRYGTPTGKHDFDM